jgi:hypothetical protein
MAGTVKKSSRVRKAAPIKEQGEPAKATPVAKPEEDRNRGMLVNEQTPVPLSAMNQPNPMSFVEVMKRMSKE